MKSITMPKAKNVSQKSKTEIYRKQLVARYGHAPLKDGELYSGSTTPLRHVCNSCQCEFKASPVQMLNHKQLATCLKCSKASMGKKQSASATAFVKKLEKKFDGIKCVTFTSNHRNGKFSCDCGHSWETKPYELLKLKHGCPSCAGVAQAEAMRYSMATIKSKLAERNPSVRVLSTKRKDSSARITVSCTTCSYEWSAHFGNLLNGKTGCPSCAKRKSKNFSSKQVSLAGRSVSVQGYEDVAIRFLVEKKGFAESKIHVFSEGKVEPIEYEFKGRMKEYWPDIRVGKTLIEVKSIFTLTDDWEKNVAKAKACLKQGFRFKLLLVSKGKVYVLPEEWIKWKAEKAEAFLRTKTLKKLRIVSFDPGVTNFAWSVLEVTRPFHVKLIATGMIDDTLKDLTGSMLKNLAPFRGEVLEILEEYSVDHMIMERFQARGMKGTTIELVNVMIGKLAAMWKKRSHRSFKLVTAAQWKNEWNRRSDLKEFYKKASCAVHQVDAIGIGMYGAAYWFDEEPFKDIVKFERVLAKQISNADIKR